LKHHNKDLKHKGLTDLKAAGTNMNALGMMVDISHVGEQTFGMLSLLPPNL
jgi:membrane dipeptidase